MARASREFAVAHRPQDPAQGLLGDGHPVILGIDLGQIAQPPAHHAVGGGRRPLFDQAPEDLTLIGVQARPSPGGLAVDQPARAIGVEGHDPITHRLQSDPADRGRLRAHATRGDHGQRQQAAGLGRVTRPLGQDAQGLGIKIRPQRYRSSHRILLRLQNQRKES